MSISSISPRDDAAPASQKSASIERLGYTIAEVCEIVPCSRAHVYRQIEAGALTKIKVGGKSIIPAWSVRSLMQGEVA